MNIVLASNRIKDEEMRNVYCSTLIDLAGKNKNIVALDGDLMSSMGMKRFAEEFPDRTFDVGIQEANMMGVAAGLSATGKIPFAHTFGPFATRRCFDQLFLSIGYSGQNVRVIGSDPGVTAAYNGGTHMPFEDMGIVRNIPNATIIEPVDGAMLADIIRQTEKLKGFFYIRLLRKNPVKIYEKGSSFEIGKGVTLKDGNDVTIIASGIMVNDSIDAANMLDREGISARVVNMFTLKPIDKQLIIKCAEETGAVVTAENHSIINGLGSAVSEVLSENIPVPLERVGIRDRFGQVGSVDYLKREYGLTVGDIVNSCKKAVNRKR
ncbi:MAG: transketolase family protein [Clostridium sp.]|jgi:transketolase|uniref:transketolase family protein n=1 Tax=Clostridium sp. TaxID=1506 RepID=UPI0025C07459|nr:transketolase family protein [Clostridium sp.]MCH3964818.1 transketolase family protein [Clostridium sp.]MCI1715289.1 transketolase family protein [Clostridium sp.]MCI1799551.1 transketolase family protein [Clostridium sp.]MCI1813472.1 transketolase family protein [Clostridium sp.]MCI1870363.1 transketolase family protein [Clostridium sp.]